MIKFVQITDLNATSLRDFAGLVGEAWRMRVQFHANYLNIDG
jgi:hypothetical protein